MTPGRWQALAIQSLPSFHLSSFAFEPMHIPSVIVLVSAAATTSAITIDTASKSAVLAAAKAAQWPLKMFYDANQENNGAWIEQFSDGHWNVQWHESGEYWGLYYKYMQYSGDYSYLDWVDKNMQLSAGGNPDFLDGMSAVLEESGRWNDDIGWWGISVMCAAETFGQNAIVAKNNVQSGFNPTYFELANVTYTEITAQWDNKCGGGIYWDRSRTTGTDNQRNYKSTITNVEVMEIGARLYAMTGIASYKTEVDQIYAWLKSSGIISSTYTIYDGVSVTDCTAINQDVYSYHAGPLLSAFAAMYRKTQDSSYQTEGNNVYNAIVRQFVASDKTLSIEPTCPTKGCKDPNAYKWPLYRGIADWHDVTTDAGIKSSIEEVMRATATANFAGCDSSWYCIRNLPAATSFTLQNGTNPRDQFETMAILNSLAIINGNTQTLNGAGVAPGGNGNQPVSTVNPSKTGGAGFLAPAFIVAAIVASLL
ncbi:glycosyl hydrolase family 76-domain-containing protein [Chytriomyces sp. MP71]|nr:glycosyl hydrolase family 76-domain-containing protein [Chytriomyces sp. MP71]